MPRTIAGIRTIAGARSAAIGFGQAARGESSGSRHFSYGNLFSSPTAISISYWIKLRNNTSSNFDVPIGKGNTNFNLIFNGTTRKPYFVVKIGGVNKNAGFNLTTALTNLQWYFLSGTYNPNGGNNNLTIRVYDSAGTLIDSYASTQTGNPDTSNTPFHVNRDEARGYYYDNDYDDLRVFSRALTPTEQDNLALNLPIDTTNLELWSKFDEFSGNALDSSGNNRTGTSTNSIKRTTGIIPKKRDIAT